MWKLARKVDQASGWGEVVAAGTDGSHLCNTCVTDLKSGVTRGQMGHPRTHVLGGTYAEPKDHTSPTLTSSTHTDRITATCQGTLTLSISLSTWTSLPTWLGTTTGGGLGLGLGRRVPAGAPGLVQTLGGRETWLNPCSAS